MMKEIVKILIADDSKSVVSFMKSYIEKEDKYKIVGTCECEQDEIEMIDKLKPDVVITDIKKKNKWTGIDIVKRYENSEYNPIFFFVLASALHYITEMRKLGIQYYLNKPFSEQEFMCMLNNAYNEIYPQKIINTNKRVVENKNQNHITKFFNIIKKRIGV